MEKSSISRTEPGRSHRARATSPSQLGLTLTEPGRPYRASHASSSQLGLHNSVIYAKRGSAGSVCRMSHGSAELPREMYTLGTETTLGYAPQTHIPSQRIHFMTGSDPSTLPYLIGGKHPVNMDAWPRNRRGNASTSRPASGPTSSAPAWKPPVRSVHPSATTHPRVATVFP